MNEELNKKLAEWAGITFFVGGWKYPDGTKGSSVNFTKSLDACFKWLVPKLKPEVVKLIPIAGIEMFKDYGKKWGCILTPERWVGKISAIADDNSSPALALCLVIKKLIDSER